ncbi:hypothetical protein ACFOWM_03335 [Ferruginibacter yonginensis]|uniref:HTH cro/C1-type domain-containing protein n=1 Tax=Ferruginibacter yonginensis TaxID=1310416 RepID=A0ABV8QQ56_9BACT
MNTTRVLTQKEELGNKLKAIKQDVTAEDKKEYIKENDTTPQTISRYLKGGVLDISTGIKMLTFFSQKIQERNALINNTKTA